MPSLFRSDREWVAAGVNPKFQGANPPSFLKIGMLFSEHDSEWKPVQSWMEFLIRFGFGWRVAPKGPRRIALISMPCDSAAAGLVALGALMRDLTIPDVNDLTLHSSRLVDYARSFVKHCKSCRLDICNPEVARCGLSGKLSGVLRSIKFPRRRFNIKKMHVDPESPFWILPVSGGGNDAPTVDQHPCFYIEGEPAPQWVEVGGRLNSEFYSALNAFLNNGAQIFQENLCRSYSGLCLAGRAAGEMASQEICSRIKFFSGGGKFGLERLLTIHGWSDCALSRVAFFNSRTGQMDRNAAAPRLVVADGEASFLKVADRQEFQDSDLVGVIHRTMEHDSLEAVGSKMAAWRQWYDFDEDMLCGLPEVPRGISISILRRRG